MVLNIWILFNHFEFNIIIILYLEILYVFY